MIEEAPGIIKKRDSTALDITILEGVHKIKKDKAKAPYPHIFTIHFKKIVRSLLNDPIHFNAKVIRKKFNSPRFHSNAFKCP